jgi:hypothetical protein
MKHVFCGLMLFFLLSSNKARAAAEVSHFNILLFGDKIGSLIASKEVRSDGTELYLLDSWSKAKVLWINHENTTHYEVIYKDGKLISSKFKEIENGELKRWTNITWDGKQYCVDGYKGKRTFTEAPTFSIVSIYFGNIQNAKRVFYEAEADFNELQHPEQNTWEFKSSDGNRNVYHCVNGKVQNMEFHVSVATVKMVRVD